jgi:hypothetical protein
MEIKCLINVIRIIDFKMHENIFSRRKLTSQKYNPVIYIDSLFELPDEFKGSISGKLFLEN